ncbi:MAG: PAS domain S-box protein, partial [Dehalococcoidales bacterium]|nr:PAS domain S-box protein [Dehalococcoidales bacterium]
MDGQRKKKIIQSTNIATQPLSIPDKAENLVLCGNREILKILESISDGVIAIDRDWRFTYVNERAASYLGFKPEDLIGQNIWERFPQIIGTMHEICNRKAMQEGKPQEYKMKGVLTDRWYHIRVYPSTNGITAYWLDITEYKQAEDRLRKSEERYRNLVESANDFIWETNTEGMCTYASPQIFEILGYRPEEVIGKTPFDLMPPEEIERILPIFQRCISQGSPIPSLEYTIYHKDGHLVFLESKGVIFYNSDGSLQGIRGIDRDITHHKNTEGALVKAKDELEMKIKERTAKLTESETKYRSLVENSNEAIIVAKGGKLIFFNKQEIELTGYSREELETMPFIDMVYPHDRELIIKKYQAGIKEEDVSSKYDIRIITKNGEIKWLEVSMALIDWGGQPALLGMLNDITARKLLEQDLKAYAQKITRVQEEERKRIAYELHDDTAQYLSILKMQIGALANSEEIQSPKI